MANHNEYELDYIDNMPDNMQDISLTSLHPEINEPTEVNKNAV